MASYLFNAHGLSAEVSFGHRYLTKRRAAVAELAEAYVAAPSGCGTGSNELMAMRELRQYGVGSARNSRAVGATCLSRRKPVMSK
jgi:predicted Rossmann-fold nucleotide-binding protein